MSHLEAILRAQVRQTLGEITRQELLDAWQDFNRSPSGGETYQAQIADLTDQLVAATERNVRLIETLGDILDAIPTVYCATRAQTSLAFNRIAGIVQEALR